MKNHILGSVTAGHEKYQKRARVIEFLNLSLFWPIYIVTTNNQCLKCIKRCWKTDFHISTTKIGPLPILLEFPFSVRYMN